MFVTKWTSFFQWRLSSGCGHVFLTSFGSAARTNYHLEMSSCAAPMWKRIGKFIIIGQMVSDLINFHLLIKSVHSTIYFVIIQWMLLNVRTLVKMTKFYIIHTLVVIPLHCTSLLPIASTVQDFIRQLKNWPWKHKFLNFAIEILFGICEFSKKHAFHFHYSVSCHSSTL